MFPFFFQYDHQNYALSRDICAAHVIQIPNEIKRMSLKKVIFIFKCSKQKFSQVDPDYTQEWHYRNAKLQEAL